MGSNVTTMTPRILSLPSILYLFGMHLHLLMIIHTALWVVIDIIFRHQRYLLLPYWL